MRFSYNIFFLSCVLLGFFSYTQAQKTVPLYKNKVPNSITTPTKEKWNKDHSIVSNVSQPTLSIYFSKDGNANGTAIIICPGGGYHVLMMKWEGSEIAERLAKRGITAFVLKYRLPDDQTMVDKSIGPIQDAQQAIKIVRENSAKWNIDEHKIGIMGFSAGGHLASTAGTHFNIDFIENKNKISLRPDFMVLVYPVISMADKLTHSGSRKNLLGNTPSEKRIREFSNEWHVNKNTPPVFITQAEDDSVVSVENSLVFYQALHENNIPVALHIYQTGGHGFLKYPPRDLWMEELFYWMKKNGWIR